MKIERDHKQSVRNSYAYGIQTTRNSLIQKRVPRVHPPRLRVKFIASPPRRLRAGHLASARSFRPGRNRSTRRFHRDDRGDGPRLAGLVVGSTFRSYGDRDRHSSIRTRKSHDLSVAGGTLAVFDVCASRMVKMKADVGTAEIDPRLVSEVPLEDVAGRHR